jgi:hypothetical protein
MNDYFANIEKSEVTASDHDTSTDSTSSGNSKLDNFAANIFLGIHMLRIDHPRTDEPLEAYHPIWH